MDCEEKQRHEILISNTGASLLLLEREDEYFVEYANKILI